MIPKDIRAELRIEEGTGFWVYSIENEGLLLKKIDAMPLDEHKKMLDDIHEKSDKIHVERKNVEKSIQKYKKTKEGNLDVI